MTVLRTWTITKTCLILSPVFLFPFSPEAISESSGVSENSSLEGDGVNSEDDDDNNDDIPR